MKIKAIIWQDDDVWCRSVPALPGCHTWGDSYEHLVTMTFTLQPRNILEILTILRFSLGFIGKPTI